MTSIASDPPALVAQQALTRGERLIWSDRAVKRKSGWGAWPIVAFGLLFAGFAALWMALSAAMTTTQEGPWRLFPFFGLPFLVIGLAIASSPLWARHVGGPSVYALTDRRVILIHGRRTRMVRSVDLERIAALHWSERADGSGDIMFEKSAEPASASDRMAAMTGIYGVAGVKHVAASVERARAARQAAVHRTT